MEKDYLKTIHQLDEKEEIIKRNQKLLSKIEEEEMCIKDQVQKLDQSILEDAQGTSSYSLMQSIVDDSTQSFSKIFDELNNGQSQLIKELKEVEQQKEKVQRDYQKEQEESYGD